MTLAMIVLIYLGDDKERADLVYTIVWVFLCTFLVCYCICGLDGMSPYGNLKEFDTLLAFSTKYLSLSPFHQDIQGFEHDIRIHSVPF